GGVVASVSLTIAVWYVTSSSGTVVPSAASGPTKLNPPDSPCSSPDSTVTPKLGAVPLTHRCTDGATSQVTVCADGAMCCVPTAAPVTAAIVDASLCGPTWP